MRKFNLAIRCKFCGYWRAASFNNVGSYIFRCFKCWKSYKLKSTKRVGLNLEYRGPYDNLKLLSVVVAGLNKPKSG